MASTTSGPCPEGECVDPYQVLGVSVQATPEEIRAAYLARVKQHPPDRSPEEFERIRDAYQVLSDPRHRARAMLSAVDPLAPLTSLIESLPEERRHVGPQPWLDAMEEH
ncbi:MAG: J domain-containing protein [Candidatus Riflebacteria bacterium]|nr:J domain-containing protein [Candidatus Riflebacteria bacterium]